MILSFWGVFRVQGWILKPSTPNPWDLGQDLGFRAAEASGLRVQGSGRDSGFRV